MLKKEIIKYLENLGTLNDYSMSELSGIMKKYPFFQTAYLLFILNLKNIDDPRFKEYLKKYSVYIKDRERLFQHLNILESYSASYFEGIKPNLEPSRSKDENEEQTTVDVKEENKNTDSVNTGKKQENTKLLQNKKKEFTTEYLRSRIARTLTQQTDEVDSQEPGADSEMTEFFILDKADELTERVSKNSSSPKENEIDSTNSGEDVSEETFELDESLKSVNKRLKEGKENKYAPDQYLPEDIYSPENKQSKDLIDQFLQNNPEIEKIEPKKEAGKDISENSVQESEDFLTEKLAHLYVKQGYFEKAIEAYQKLSLKYPEKSDYFAQQIERIKQLKGEQ
ncbi:MAG: hypothetical protein ACQESJ_03470 [Bacteroidota bacterium]